MSSDSISAVQDPQARMLQGMQQTSPARPVQGDDSRQRYEVATGGQKLPQAEKEDAPQTEKIESAVSQIRDFVQNFQRDLVFSIDRESDRLVVKVLDSETREVIRQIPSEETLRMAEHLDSPESLILREQA